MAASLETRKSKILRGGGELGWGLYHDNVLSENMVRRRGIDPRYPENMADSLSTNIPSLLSFSCNILIAVSRS